MKPVQIFNSILSIISSGSVKDSSRSGRFWFGGPSGSVFYIKKDELQIYFNLIDDCFMINKKVRSDYTRKTFFQELEKAVLDKKKKAKVFSSTDVDNFISVLIDKNPISLTVFTPISGVSLKSKKRLEIGPYIIQEYGPEEIFPVPQVCLHIGLQIKGILDVEKAKEKAVNEFADFSRIVHFLIGRFNRTNIIKFGLPVYPDSLGRVSVDMDSFSFVEDGKFHGSSLQNNIYNTIPIDDDFFTNHDLLKGIWELQNRKHAGGHMTKMQERVLAAAKAVGESARSGDVRNSILYACIAVESLFSFQESSLFQQSIGDKIAEAMAFMVGNTVDQRLKIENLVKKTYGIRSAISHGGDASLNDDYIILNSYTRKCIADMMTERKYGEIKSIEEFYRYIKILKYS